MPHTEHTIARRTIIKGAGLGLGAGLVSTLAHSQETTGAAAQTAGEIWSSEYSAKKSDVTLSLWRKRIDEPNPGEPPPPDQFLVHASSNYDRTSHDLTVPGLCQDLLMH